eukprot:GHVT01052451.1.p1 GENE.GHVT01052451.1~~GHVT01052451.1.p1  ORF type:complete len:108 (+),score=9.07 GHVT01052451.1:35-325(+)
MTTQKSVRRPVLTQSARQQLVSAVQAANSSERNYFSDFPSFKQNLAPTEDFNYRQYPTMTGLSDTESGDNKSGDDSCGESVISPPPGVASGVSLDM